jgi:adenylate kinase
MFKPPTEEGICDLCGGELYRRDDDNPDTVRARLRTYHGQTAPLINHYRKQGLLLEIDGEGDVSKVTEKALAAIQEIFNTQLSNATQSKMSQTEFA